MFLALRPMPAMQGTPTIYVVKSCYVTEHHTSLLYSYFATMNKSKKIIRLRNESSGEERRNVHKTLPESLQERDKQ
jgi:hypothetical protein